MAKQSEPVVAQGPEPKESAVPEPEALYAALAKAQGEFGPVKMDKEGKVFYQAKDNRPAGSYSYKYGSLGAIIDATRPALNKYGLSISQDVTVDYSMTGAQNRIIPQITVRTTIFHTSGESLTSSPMTLLARDGAAQSVGSTVTYCKRYQMGALLSVYAEEDDDAQGAQPDQAPQSPQNRGGGHGQPRGGGRAPAQRPAPPAQQQPPNLKQQEMMGNLVVGGVVRYDRQARMLNEDYQKANMLINSGQFHELQGLIRTHLGGQMPKFEAWLLGVYQVRFYDIRQDAYAGIVETIQKRPQEIMNYGNQPAPSDTTRTREPGEDDDMPFPNGSDGVDPL